MNGLRVTRCRRQRRTTFVRATSKRPVARLRREFVVNLPGTLLGQTQLCWSLAAKREICSSHEPGATSEAEHSYGL